MVNRVHTSGTVTLSGEPAMVKAFAGYMGTFRDPKGRPIDVLKAMELQFYTDVGRVGDDYLGPERLPTTRVSTVWLNEPHHEGMYRRPQWETMVFADDEEWDTYAWRWWTRRQAEIGHRRVVRLMRLLVCTSAPVVKPHKTRNRHWRG